MERGKWSGKDRKQQSGTGHVRTCIAGYGNEQALAVIVFEGLGKDINVVEVRLSTLHRMT